MNLYQFPEKSVNELIEPNFKKNILFTCRGKSRCFLKGETKEQMATAPASAKNLATSVTLRRRREHAIYLTGDKIVISFEPPDVLVPVGLAEP